MKRVESEQISQIKLRKTFENSIDFKCNEIIVNHKKAYLYYLDSLVDYVRTLDLLAERLRDREEEVEPIQHLAMLYGAKVNLSLDEIVKSLLQGMLVIFHGEENLVINTLQTKNSRSIAEAQNENLMHTAMDAFTEDLNMNISLLRKKVITKDLVIQSFTLGEHFPRRLSVLHIKDHANPNVVEMISNCLNDNQKMDISDNQGLMKALNQPRFSIIPNHVSSELTTTAKRYLQDGRVVILLDQYPFALSFPALVSDFWEVKSDREYPVPFMILFRLIRLIALFIAISLPGFYVILNAVNPELLRIQLAVAVINSRAGVPYPVLVEVFINLLIIEMVIEASIRLPKNIAQTITMAGAIILGETLVQARLVSNLLIIIVSASTIAHFALGTYMNSLAIRVYKYVVIVFSIFYGILGLMSAIVVFCFYLGSITTFSVPYLSWTAKWRESSE